MTKEATYWNGESCEAEKVRVIVGVAEKPTWWFAGLEGTERRAVRITQQGYTFYIDNDQSPASYEGRAWTAGEGWEKVTVGRGTPQWPHAALNIMEDLGTDADIEIQKIRDRYKTFKPLSREDFPSRQAYRYAKAKQFGNNRP